MHTIYTLDRAGHKRRTVHGDPLEARIRWDYLEDNRNAYQHAFYVSGNGTILSSF